MRVKKTCRERGKKYHFQKGGINIVFGPKYRPLRSSSTFSISMLSSIWHWVFSNFSPSTLGHIWRCVLFDVGYFRRCLSTWVIQCSVIRCSVSWRSVDRVAIFRKKIIARNSGCFAEEKNLGIPFQTICRKRETLGIPLWTIFGQEKPRNSVPNYFRKRKTSEFHSDHFRKRKNFGIPFQTIFGKEKTSEFHSEPICGTENPFKNPFQTIFGNRKHSIKDHFC